MQVDIRPLEPALLEDYLRFFDDVAFADHKEWAWCYCTFYHLGKEDEERLEAEFAGNWTRDALRGIAVGLIQKRALNGYLAYENGQVVGWCNAADKKNYKKLCENRSILFWLHLTPAAVFLLPLGNIILPLILWLSHKDKTSHVREQGANIINFQILWYVVTVIIVGILMFGLKDYMATAYMLLLVLMTNVIYPVFVAIRIRKGKIRNYYPAIIRFIR